jgi:hypothetical protein
VIRKAVLAVAAGVIVAGTVAAYADPVDDVLQTVNDVAHVRPPVVDRPPVLGGGVTGVSGRSAVVGYIFVQASGDAVPTYTLAGALGDADLWACHGGGTSASYTVSCVPASAAVELTWHCDVLHADVSTTSAAGLARTTLDCDSDGVGEAQTATVSGLPGHDSKWSVDTRLVTAFTCTIDGGGADAHADWTGGCGDPGLVGVE